MSSRVNHCDSNVKAQCAPVFESPCGSSGFAERMAGTVAPQMGEFAALLRADIGKAGIPVRSLAKQLANSHPDHLESARRQINDYLAGKRLPGAGRAVRLARLLGQPDSRYDNVLTRDRMRRRLEKTEREAERLQERLREWSEHGAGEPPPQR